MPATALNLPKWLLAAVVCCVLVGHFQQWACKLHGCSAAAVAIGAKAPASDSADPAHGDNDCGCQCHVIASAFFEVPPRFTALRFVRNVEQAERTVPAPDAPCAEIKYPPRSLRA